MGILDYKALLAEVTVDNPVGDNLEYDPAFVELERAAESRPEQSLGDATVAGEEADWKKVRTGAIDLLAKSKDLRLAVLLTRAMVYSHGWQGMEDGLALVRGLVENYWPTLHPQLDADDDNDPTFRINTLVTLCDREATLSLALDSPLVAVKGLGEFSLHDYKVANGDLAATGDTDQATPEMPVIAGAFMECDINHVKELSASLAAAHDHVKALDAYLMAEVGSASAPDWEPLLKTIVEAQVVVNEHLARRGESVDAVGESRSGTTASAMPASNGAINSREDAARMMDRISDYFVQHEPSSPVPLLMQRAKRLSNLGFLEILRDLAPDGLNQAQNIGGVKTPEGD